MSFNFIKTSIVSACLLATSLSALAVPAKPGLIPMTQPDGSVIEVRLVGDERSHYTLTEDGYLLSPVNGTYYYATISTDGMVLPTSIRATSPDSRSAEARAFIQSVDLNDQAAKMKARDAVAAASRSAASAASFSAPRAPQKSEGQGFPQGPGLFPGTHFPAVGEQKGLVVLVEYTDVKFTLDDPHDYFYRMLNENGFSAWGATGSAVDFFTESSTGLFKPQFDVYGPITLAHNQAYYGGNNWSGDDQNPEEMTIEACQQLDATVDFSEYDRDGDGYIDNVFVFYAGRGEASGGSANTVWPHAWTVSATHSTPYIFDGVRLDRYACSNEWESGRPDGVGTFVHEFSHVMGLPDLYATSYTSAFTPGAWSAMDYGPYNNNGMTPPLYSAFERYALGWIEPSEITGPMDVTLPSIGNNVCGIVKTTKDNEYFLFENRQKTSWDTYIPGHGMLVWHIDYSEYVWDYNKVNNTPSHQYVDIEEADGTQSSYTRDGDAFPGASNVTTFTADGNPAFKTWGGTAIDLPLTAIAETDGVITFKVAGGRTEPLTPPVAIAATECTATSFVANWEPVEGATNYLVTLRKLTEADPEATEEIFTLRSVGNATSYLIEDLESESIYEYEVSAGSALEFSVPSNAVIASTGRLPINFLTPLVSEATDITETSFTANWVALDDATDYILRLYEKVWGAPYTTVCDFAEGAKVLPEGWTASSQAGYANTAYSGQAIPSLRLSTGGDYIATCKYEENVRSVSFWHRGSAASDPEDCINLLAKVDNKWVKVASFPIVTEKGGSTCTCDEIPADVFEIRLEYIRKSEKGSVAIDDITIFWGMTFAKVAIEGFEEGRHTDNVISFPIDGLEPGTTYTYNIVATDGELFSNVSDDIDVTTSGEKSAIAEITGPDKAAFSVDGRTITALIPVSVYDITGRTVARIAAGRSTSLPAGFYVVASAEQTTKISIK